MNIILLFRAPFNKRLSGAELRYVNLAQELTKKGHSVTIVGTARDTTVDHDVAIIAMGQIVSVFKVLSKADVIIVHGGGPLLTIIMAICSLCGKKVYSDAYAFHWIEIYQAHTYRKISTFKTYLKSIYYLLRWHVVVRIYDGVLCANKRQLDYIRGGYYFSSRLGYERNVRVVPLGCELPLCHETGRSDLMAISADAINSDDFLVGWIGGLWPWLNIDVVLKAFAELSEKHSDIKLVFFGVDAERRENLNKSFAVFGGKPGRLVFLPHIDFDLRLQIWSGLDLAVVWGGSGLENDYASRTRNYDCITIGLPIIQNYDDQWGPILTGYKCGIVIDESAVRAELERCYVNRALLREMHINMQQLASKYSWEQSVNELCEHIKMSRITVITKFINAVLLLLSTPVLLISLSISLAADLYLECNSER